MKVIVADDQEDARLYMKAALETNGFAVELASNGLEALRLARENLPDLIISDALMPEMDGFELCREIKMDAGLKTVPFIFYTGSYLERKDKELALGLGAIRYLHKPMDPDELLPIINEAVASPVKETPAQLAETMSEETYSKLHSEAVSIKLDQKIEQLEIEKQNYRNALIQTITVMARAIEQRDPYTFSHQNRVSHLAGAIAQELGLDDHQIEGIRMGGIIHDIGKIHISSEILNRPGKISENEFALIKEHPEIGYQIIKDVEFPWPLANIVHQHHERLDGSGYPQGLKGDEISLEAKIISVADVVEAISSHRPYRPALGIGKALQIIEQGRGQAFESKIVDACIKLIDQGFDIDSHNQ